MKANELRIGNWVKYFHPECGFCDTQIDHEEIGLMCSDDFENSDYEIEPIPLTEEWLIKFGFKFNGSYYDSSDAYFELDKYKGNYINGVNCCEYNHGIEIKYVHQLQNLYFALTGEELTTRL